MAQGGFELWKLALVNDRKSSLGDSKSSFQAASNVFFEEASNEKSGISRALYEYSTLMDSFAKVQDGRLLKTERKFDESLDFFAKATEILRATVHFGFLAGYVSGCASLETASEMEDYEEKFQGFKNSIALFEQSKLALSFRDERHPLIRAIDGLIKFSISRALLLEAEMLSQMGSASDSRKKREQSENVEEEFRILVGSNNVSSISRFKIDYFLKGYDCERALEGSYLSTFPERTSLWIGNVGVHPTNVQLVGKSQVEKIIEPSKSIEWPLLPDFRGRLRITYTDESNKRKYDEGCLTAV